MPSVSEGAASRLGSAEPGVSRGAVSEDTGGGSLAEADGAPASIVTAPSGREHPAESSHEAAASAAIVPLFDLSMARVRTYRVGRAMLDTAWGALSIYHPAPMSTIALVGYGRFGAAFGALLLESGERVRAFDPGASVPETLRAGSLSELAAGADFVALAVPVARMAAAVAALRPHLGPTHVVFDVGSVKVGPTAVLAAKLGREVPWVATHPLFGPVSLMSGERPLRAVVCPSAVHPGAAAAVGALFRRIGCEVAEQDPDAHDRAMALTHALAFFVAKGMMDAGVPTDLVYVPPSFEAIERTIEAVRGDAGHLFTALHRENPYAADARRALLEALGRADRSLRDDHPTAEAAADLSIPDLGAVSPALAETRELIDEIDRDLLALLGRRALLARRAAAAKAELGLAVRDGRREAELLSARRRDAERLGLDPEGVGGVFEAVLRFSRRVQSS
jgi:prephenate dehydrogenase